MIIASHQDRARSRTAAWRTLIGLAILLPVTACASGGSAAGGSAATPGSSVLAGPAACQQVGTVLTNGPDPGTDPVGYAQAQILPLRLVRTSDGTLASAISGLADAYSGYYAGSGTSQAATATLTAAIKQINSLCPGTGATP